MTQSTHAPDCTLNDGLLDDACLRCREHATDPFAGLDNHHLGELLTRVETYEHARSANEGLAMRHVRDAVLTEDRLRSLRAMGFGARRVVTPA